METFTNDVLAWILGYLLNKILSQVLKQVPCALGTEPWCLIHLTIQTMVGESHHVSQPNKISNCKQSGRKAMLPTLGWGCLPQTWCWLYLAGGKYWSYHDRVTY